MAIGNSARKGLHLLAGLMAFLVVTVQAQAAELKFASIETAPWASFNAENGAAVGAFPDVVREMAQRSGLSITLSLRPFARLFPELEAGDQDCTILIWSDSRSDFLERGETVYLMPFGVIARRGKTLEKYEDLGALTISVLRGLNIDNRFDTDTSLRKDLDTNYQTGLRKITHHRLDAIAGALPTIRYMAAQEKVEYALGDQLVLKEVPIALQCSVRSANLHRMEALNKVLREMRADGTLQALLSRNYYE